MESEYRTLEITVLSGEDLRIDRKNVKKNTYVLVRTDTLNYRTLDSGGSYPSWNQKLILDMPLRESFITIEVHCKTSSLRRDRIIGSTRIPVADCTGGHIPANYLNFVSYRLRDPRGERNGIINLSVKVKLPEYLSQWPQKICSATAALAIPISREKSLGIGTVLGYMFGSPTTKRQRIRSLTKYLIKFE